MRNHISAVILAGALTGCVTSREPAKPLTPEEAQQSEARRICEDAAAGHREQTSQYEGWVQSCMILRLREMRAGML
ncbi:hypothetical protein [Ferrovibrio sp.]|uniref:hypothetical protein n=1 Tax=Ferrovibrio sp. TaxID=1917215 RepID=UPI002627C5AB|nr:hypothetical protein [Ferrovibrio sp.]